MTSTLKPLGIEKALQSIASHQTAWEKVVASMQKPLGIEKALQSIASHQTAWEKVVASIKKPSAIEQAVHLINKSSDVFLNRPSIVSEMAESIAEFDFRDDFSDEEGDIDELFVEASEQLSSVSDNHAFIELFRKFPPLLQAFIFFVLLHVFLPQINNIKAWGRATISNCFCM